MVTLFVSDLEQVTILEYELMKANVKYKRQLDDGKYGLTTPYIKVYGVPLDEIRAIKWIREYKQNK